MSMYGFENIYHNGSGSREHMTWQRPRNYRTHHLVEIRPKGRGQLGSRHWERSESDHHHRSYRGRQDGSRRREGGPHSSSSNSIRLPLLGDLKRWKRDGQESTSSNIDEGRQRYAAQMRFDTSMRAKVRFSGFSYYRAANRVRSHDQSFKFEFREPAPLLAAGPYIHDMFPFFRRLAFARCSAPSVRLPGLHKTVDGSYPPSMPRLHGDNLPVVRYAPGACIGLRQF